MVRDLTSDIRESLVARMNEGSGGVVTDPHVTWIRDVIPRAAGCEECLQEGTGWVHLRLCLTCGHVGCCDSSPMRHARAHAGAVGHPIVRSFEPGEHWRWCFVDESFA